MAVPNGGNQIARLVIDDLIKFSGQTSVDGYMSFFNAQQITETQMEALEDQEEMFDTLMDLRDDKEAANTKLQGLNALIA
ncbi:hypothetical protein Tco_0934599 [Tanacetum coccineum]